MCQVISGRFAALPIHHQYVQGFLVSPVGAKAGWPIKQDQQLPFSFQSSGKTGKVCHE